MHAQIELPARFEALDGVSEGSGFTLHDDGSVELAGVALGERERAMSDGRHCLDGDVESSDHRGRWALAEPGWLRIEAGGRYTRLRVDDALMGWGWARLYALTPCDSSRSGSYVTRDLVK